jgi:hypothetical protein
MRHLPQPDPAPPLKDNQILRRYLDLSKFIDLLRTKSLYLRRADLFHDKFEGSFTPSLRAAIEEAYSVHKVDFSYEKFKKELREGVYVNCWSLGANDNMALWNIYGKSEASVAVQTTVKRLRSEISTWQPGGNTSIDRVEYIKHWRDPAIDIHPYSNVFRYKVIAYEFEKEARIIHDRMEHNFAKSEKDTGLHIPVQLNRLITSIVVSPSAQPWFFELVTDVAKRYGVTAQVKPSRLAIDPI